MTVYSDEIDLRPYLFALYKNWWRICLVALLAASAAFVFSILQQDRYEAVATILVTRIRAALSLAEQFPTVNEPIDSNSRMQAMVVITGSDSVLLRTLERTQKEYPNKDIDLKEFKEIIDIERTGDIIQITVKDTDPEYATYIANSLAQNAVTAITYAYKGEPPPDEIQTSLESAFKASEMSQAELESFLKENQIDTLKSKIAETQALLDGLTQNQTWQMAYQLQRMHKMEQVLDQANLLTQQLKSSKSSPAASLGDALAVLRLYAEAFGGEEVIQKENDKIVNAVSSTEPEEPAMIFDIQVSQLIDGGEINPNYQRDLEEIILRAEGEKEKAETALIELAQQSTDPDFEEIFALTANKLSELASNLESEEAKLAELTSRRDLDLNAYQVLAQKETEIRNNLQTSSSVVLAGSAVTPQEPVSRGVVRNTVIAGAFGFFLGIVWVLGSLWKDNLGHIGDSNQDK